MNKREAEAKLAKCGQSHVLGYWSKLKPSGREALLAQVEKLDLDGLESCKKTLENVWANGREGEQAARATRRDGLPVKVVHLKGKKLAEAVAAGEKELKAGRVAVLLVAGGQGSRLGFDGPKGCYPIGPVTGKPLFWFHTRKVLALKRRYGKSVPFYIMTSEGNNAATTEFFEKNGYFGLDKEDIFFFTQGQWPGMTADGKIILDNPSHIFTSPDGHGGLLAALKRSGALADMKRRGIKSIFFFQVDNPLVDIASPSFIGAHVLAKSQYSLKLYAKEDPMDKLGMPMRFGDRCKMIEYSEMTEEQCRRKAKDGKLYYLYGSPAIHVFDRTFLERAASKAMPIHLAFKKIPFVDTKGKTVKPSAPNGYKFEKFIFDILPDAERTLMVAFERKEECSPVKNAEGTNSPATCRAEMQEKWRRMLARAGVEVPDGIPVEIDPAYAIDSKDIIEKGILL